RKIQSEFPAGDVRSAGCVGARGHRGAGGAGRLHDRRARAAAGAGRRLQGWRQGSAGDFGKLKRAIDQAAISADWMRLTPALAISAQAFAIEPWVSMPRQASSTT